MKIIILSPHGANDRFSFSYIHLIHDTRQPWGRGCWFLRKQTSEKHCQWKKLRLSLFILDNRKWRPFHLKDDNVKIWVEVIIVTLQYAVATANIPMSNSNDVNLANTLDNYEIVVSFDRINKLDRDYSYWQILSLVCPWNTTWHSFYPIDLRARAKMAGIVNKVYSSCYATHSPSFLCSHKLGSKR